MKNLIIVFSILLAFNVDAKYVNGTVYDDSGQGLSGVNVVIKGTNSGTTTDINGFYSIEVAGEKITLVFSYVGYETQEIKVDNRKIIDVVMNGATELEEVVVSGYAKKAEKRSLNYSVADQMQGRAAGVMISYEQDNYHNTEEYSTIHENGFKKVLDNALSTFSIDVDAASYSNMRRFINNGQLPPKDAVRIEEMINYFNYEYENPTGKDPFSINTEVARAPWNEKHLIAQIGLQGKKIELENLPASNIVFLLDVSGSMSAPNKLPLLKSAFKLLVNELRPQDKVSIVVYAGAAGVVLEPTDGNDKKKIMEALDRLQAGGSTAGGAGINLAYKLAKEQFVEGGNNRVVLATDGDFNVGASSNASMERLIEEKRNEGVFLTVLGFGMGNYKDSKMEILADKGNGNYAYIDNMKEAKKVLVNEFGGTMFTIAKDVKIQVEFNPNVVQAYRLIGYENRLLNDEDFNDDKKDAGELGSGHTVTALYEIIPVGVESEFVKDIDPLKYQSNEQKVTNSTDELLTVKFRYKEPDGSKSKLITQVVENEIRKSSDNLDWSMAVAGFGMLLRDSEYKNDLSYADVLSLAKKSKGEDGFGYRAEFIELVDLASRMNTRQ
ncbi:Ca-activated chloride channel family protein [Ekhidna lutea]|uniref:Ca-activated chloride channel family protein n=1 Tax=Ekhidna lutea TaxID=447679 RepID=A0A239FK10_EKHLU|nr:VWA domain-containing protein [Ekhidna lutea]SNS56908.1 Ca-activated chloride channel family protein [Ekhidna lutea]